MLIGRPFALRSCVQGTSRRTIAAHKGDSRSAAPPFLTGHCGGMDREVAIHAAVVCVAADRDDILTSDPSDLRVLAEAADIHIELIDPVADR